MFYHKNSFKLLFISSFLLFIWFYMNTSSNDLVLYSKRQISFQDSNVHLDLYNVSIDIYNNTSIRADQVHVICSPLTSFKILYVNGILPNIKHIQFYAADIYIDNLLFISSMSSSFGLVGLKIFQRHIEFQILYTQHKDFQIMKLSLNKNIYMNINKKQDHFSMFAHYFNHEFKFNLKKNFDNLVHISDLTHNNIQLTEFPLIFDFTNSTYVLKYNTHVLSIQEHNNRISFDFFPPLPKTSITPLHNFTFKDNNNYYLYLGDDYIHFLNKNDKCLYVHFKTFSLKWCYKENIYKIILKMNGGTINNIHNIQSRSEIFINKGFVNIVQLSGQEKIYNACTNITASGSYNISNNKLLLDVNVRD